MCGFSRAMQETPTIELRAPSIVLGAIAMKRSCAGIIRLLSICFIGILCSVHLQMFVSRSTREPKTSFQSVAYISEVEIFSLFPNLSKSGNGRSTT